uniref:DH domain-containing protein n=1 Tax=Macrostomum lignano TaxID=282301 RepID=A0A1I8F1W1_9PLAT
MERIGTAEAAESRPAEFFQETDAAGPCGTVQRGGSWQLASAVLRATDDSPDTPGVALTVQAAFEHASLAAAGEAEAMSAATVLMSSLVWPDAAKTLNQALSSCLTTTQHRTLALHTAAAICLIFPSSLPRLHELHSAFLSELERRLPGSQAAGPDSFSSVLLCLYRDYANDYRCALATLRKCLGRSGRLRRLLRCLQRHPSCQGLDLPAYLLTPLRASTPDDHPDLPALVGAMEKLRHLLDGLDVSIHSALKHQHQHQAHQQQQANHSRQHQSRKNQHQQQKQPRLAASSCDSCTALAGCPSAGRLVRRSHLKVSAGSTSSAAAAAETAQGHSTGASGFFSGGCSCRRHRPDGPEESGHLSAAARRDRCHSAGDILRQQQQQQTLRTGVDKPTSPIQPAPLATWEEPPLRPPFSGARRRAKSTSSRPTAAIKESLRRVFLVPGESRRCQI